MTRLQSVIRIITRRRLAVARQQRLRERQRAGLSIAPTPFDDAIIELLLDLGWLELSASEQRSAVGQAIYRMLSEFAKAPRLTR